jgi:hypothetical protein
MKLDEAERAVRAVTGAHKTVNEDIDEREF